MFGYINHTIGNESPFKIPWCFGDFLKKIEPPGPITGLLSYPGSGNTWIRDHSQITLTGFLPPPPTHRMKFSLCLHFVSMPTRLNPRHCFGQDLFKKLLPWNEQN